MKRTLIISLVVLIFLFAGITLLKSPSSRSNPEIGVSEKTIPEKEKIRQFWRFYRQATQDRLSGKMEEAAVAYRKALEYNGKHEDALYYLGNVYLELGEHEGAEKAWRRLLRINPYSARAHFQLGDLYLSFEDEQYFNVDAAEAEYRRALEINKEETSPTLRLGYVALIRGNLSESKRYFDAVIGSNYKSVEAHFLKGYIAWKEGNPQRALIAYKDAVKYARPEQPKRGVLGEGDTKGGRSFVLPESSKHQTLFDVFIRDLSLSDGGNFSRQMENRYRKLDAFLTQIRDRIKP